MFYIRADANDSIATGHIMRCISIANAISNLGEKVVFITADLQSENFIKQNGHSIICLHSEWNNLERELEKMIHIIEEKKIEKILIDSYFITEYYLMEIRKYARIIYLDDLASFKYPVDMLINYNIYAHTIGYEKWYINTKTVPVLGCIYAPLRQEFENVNTVFSPKVKRILLSTGGADNHHVSSKFLQYIIENNFEHRDVINKNVWHKELDNIEFHVIVGKFNMDKEILISISKCYPNIILHIDANNMKELMCQCDLAITAGGSIMYELCACGIPMITYTSANNQRLGVLEFEKKGLAIYSGDIQLDKNVVLEKIWNSIQEYCVDEKRRKKVSEKMKSIVDGYGAKRLAKIIMDF